MTDIRERFESKVERTPTCWLWRGALNNMGYGVLKRRAGSSLAHRIAFELFKGPIQHGLIVRHSCDTPRCVNPHHLCVGTKRDNTNDMVFRGRARFGVVRGEGHPGAKLTTRGVALMKLLLECGVASVRLATLFGVSDTKVAHVKLGRAWSHVPPLEVPASC